MTERPDSSRLRLQNFLFMWLIICFGFLSSTKLVKETNLFGSLSETLYTYKTDLFRVSIGNFHSGQQPVEVCLVVSRRKTNKTIECI
ncbi:hypothetical protein M8C21_019283, partial [Ambrosia artemisiifolia]